MSSKAALVEALGLTVVPVETLRDCVVYVPDHRVVLIRPDITSQDWDDALDYLLVAACSPPGR